jgi:hypothetical protein
MMYLLLTRGASVRKIIPVGDEVAKEAAKNFFLCGYSVKYVNKAGERVLPPWRIKQQSLRSATK